MKLKIFIIISSLFLLGMTGCDREPVLEGPPRVMNSTLLCSGCVTGVASYGSHTARLHLTGQARNFLLVEAYNTEYCCGTESITILDSLEGNNVYLRVIDNGPFTYCYCLHNTQFWLGPFEDGESYTLTFIESEHSYYRDTLSIDFVYSQQLDISVIADTTISMLRNNPFGTARIEFYDCEDVSDSLYNLLGYNIDSISFIETDDTLLVEIILFEHCCIEYAPFASVSGDTLKLCTEIDASHPCDCECYYLFKYYISGYWQQSFYYQFIIGDRIKFKGKYNLP